MKLRRVTVRNLIMAALLFLVAWALIPLLTSVEYAEVRSIPRRRTWPLLVLALIVGQTQFFPEPRRRVRSPGQIALLALLTLQTASQFVSLAIPSAAGRVAMNTVFLTKFGLPVPVALGSGLHRRVLRVLGADGHPHPSAALRRRHLGKGSTPPTCRGC